MMPIILSIFLFIVNIFISYMNFGCISFLSIVASGLFGVIIYFMFEGIK